MVKNVQTTSSPEPLCQGFAQVKRLKTGSEVDRNSPDEVIQNHTGVLESQRVSSPVNHQLESSENSLSQPPTLESPSANLTPNGTVSECAYCEFNKAKIYCHSFVAYHPRGGMNH